MDHAAYHVVYVDTRVSQGMDGKYIRDHSIARHEGAKTRQEEIREDEHSESLTLISKEMDEIRCNIETMIAVFHGGTFLQDGSNWL